VHYLNGETGIVEDADDREDAIRKGEDIFLNGIPIDAFMIPHRTEEGPHE
jgi:hypothetical protein